MESDISAVRARIQVVGHRLIGLAERGVDTAGLQSRLVQAGDLLEGGAVEDARGLVDEVAGEVRRAAAGEARASGELQGVIRDRLKGELREAIDGGLADAAVEKMMTDLRREMETRLETFERRLRDQFARELAQVVSSRPWMKDILAQRAEAPVATHAAAAQPSTALFAQLREQVSGLRQRIEKGGTDRIDRALSDLAAAEEGMADLVANVADFQAQLGERVLALEERLAATITPVPAAVTRLTDLHVEVDAAPAEAEPAAGEATAGSQAWPFGDESRSEGPSLTQATIERMVDAATSSVVAPAAGAEGPHHTPHPMQALRGPRGTEPHALETSQTPRPMPVPETSAAYRGIDVGQIRRLIEERLAAWKAPAGEGLVADDDELVAILVRLMPQVLEDGSVRTALFATIALEAIEKPGALAHLSGLRDFLRQELAQATAV